MSAAAKPLQSLDLTFEDTRERIYAYLRAMKPMCGVEGDEGVQRGRELIAVLAESSEGTYEPKRKLTLDEAAYITEFMRFSEPRDPKTFCLEAEGKPSIPCGQMMVINAVHNAIVNALNDA